MLDGGCSGTRRETPSSFVPACPLCFGNTHVSLRLPARRGAPSLVSFLFRPPRRPPVRIRRIPSRCLTPAVSRSHVRDCPPQSHATVVLADHTWRAKLSLLTLGRDIKPGNRLGSSLKVDNNVTRAHRAEPPREQIITFFPRPRPSRLRNLDSRCATIK